MLDLTTIILTMNEEKNIAECIESIKGFSKRIIIVDSYSDDNTITIAKSLGAEVVQNRYEYYAQQFNWAIDNMDIKTDWILRLDSDERLTESIISEINDLGQKLKLYNGISMDAKLFFLGRELKFGGAKKRKMMFFRNGFGRIEDRRRDAHTIISKGKIYSIKNKFIHKNYKNLTDFTKKYNKYSSFEVEDYILYQKEKNYSINTSKEIMKRRKRKFEVYYRFPLFFRCWLWFIYNYILKLGFLDGKEGLVYNFLECYWYRFLVDSKILEVNRGAN